MNTIIALLWGLLLFLQQIPPVPNAHVADFAEVLSPVVQDDLEQQLREYRSVSTNHVEVVTVNSLDGRSIEEYATELFRAWGIGEAGADNGVLLLVAPNEREMRIEVGYGLEDDLTDAQSRRIIDLIMIPQFREGNMENGIVLGAHAVLEEIGTMTPEARAEVREQARQARAIQREQTKQGIMSFLEYLLGFVLLAGTAVWGIRSYRRNRLRARLLRRIKSQVTALEVQMRSAEELLTEARNALTLPRITRELHDVAVHLRQRVVSAQATLEEAKVRAGSDSFDEAESLIQSVAHIDIESEASEAINRIRSAYNQALEDAPKEMEALRLGISGLFELKKVLEVEGFLMGPFNERIQTVSDDAVSAGMLFKEDRYDPKTVLQTVRLVAENMQQIVTDMTELSRLKTSNDRSASELRVELAKLRKLYDEELPPVRRAVREEVYAARRELFEEKCNQFEAGSVTLDAKISRALELNGMERQEFVEAQVLLANVAMNIREFNKNAEMIVALLKNYRAARNTMPGVKKVVHALKREVEQLITNSDVGSRARGYFEEGRRHDHQAKTEEERSRVDWMTVAELYEKARAAFQAAKDQALNDISRARRRRQEDEERQRREEERRRQAAYRSSYSSSFSSGSSFGGGGGSSFGGFGGGSSGGGGASGRW